MHAASRRPRLLETIFVVVVLGGFVLFVAPTLGQPLLERHAFRQTQTAYTARIFHEQGIDLLNPKLPVFGEPFEVPFEFPLFQAAASVVMDAGVRDDVAMRLTGLACFLLTALLLCGLVRRVDSRVSGLAALVAFVSTQFAVLWSRSSMIEYLATAGAVGFAWATIVWRENRRPSVGGLALAAGLVGMLVKPTTAVFWVLPVLGYRPSTRRAGQRGTDALSLVALVMIPLLAAVLWTRHADAIKAATPATAWLTSSALGDWNFGTFDQRLDLDVWEEIGDRLLDYILGPAGVALLVVAVIGVVMSSQRLFWLGIALAAVLPPLVFTNLYHVHDYYLAAITPAIAALIGLGVGSAWRLLSRRMFAFGLAAVIVLHLATSAHELKRSYWAQAFAHDPGAWPRLLANEVAARTRPDDRVAIVGLDWSPEVLYYAKRWGHMVVERNRDRAFDAIHTDGYRYLLVADPANADLTPLSRWTWLGALSPYSYAIADEAEDLESAQFVATEDGGAVVSPGKELRQGIRVACGKRVRLPTGQHGTLIRVRNPSPEARVSVTDELAPLPARRAIFVDPQLLDAGSLTLTCSGRPALVVDVLEAPFPSAS